MIPGVDLPTIVDVVTKPTGVDMGSPQADPPQVDALFDDAVFDRALDKGFKTYELNEPIDRPEAASSKAGLTAFVIVSSHRSMFQACKGTSARLR